MSHPAAILAEVIFRVKMYLLVDDDKSAPLELIDYIEQEIC